MIKRLRRSLLFVPAHQPGRIQDALQSQADAVVIDLEAAVTEGEKARAREILSQVLADLDTGDKELFLRINTLGTLNSIHDLAFLASLPRLPDTIILPTVESPREVQLLASWLDEMEKPGQEPAGIAVILESAQGMFQAAEIAKASQRVTAVIFGGGDFSQQIGCAEQWEPLLYGRHTVVLAATVAGVDAIDVPFRDAEDEAGLRSECARVRAMGFSGKGLIHPGQAPVVNEAFSAS